MNVAEVKWRCDLQKWGREGQVGSIHAELGIICSTNIGWEAACLAALLQKKAALRGRQTSRRAAQGGLHPTKHVEGFGPAAQHQ